MAELDALLREAAAAGSGPVSDAMEVLGLARSVVTGLQLVSDDEARVLAGPAYPLRQAPKPRTVGPEVNRTRQREASSKLALPGDVIVIDAGGRTDVCTWGENQALMARSRGVAGLVAYGAIRDSHAIRRSGFPVLCRGFSPVTSRWDLETVAMDEPVVIAGVLVRPGDVVYGDCDGLLVIPRERAAEVLRRALDIHRDEERKREELHG